MINLKLDSVIDGDLSLEDTIATLKWRHEDIDAFDIDPELVGTHVFNDETRPYRLYDLSHQNKNMTKNIKKFVDNNGYKSKLGGRNRLKLTLFVQSTMSEFKKLDDSRTPGMWIERVDAILAHCRNDHSHCDILGRNGL